MRAYVAARPPMSSLYEIVLMVSLLLMAFETGAFLFCRNRTYTLMVPVTLMASVLLFFAKFVLESGDTFQPIPAVLNSSVFLTIHVFTIALGFAGMILSGVVAHLVLFRSARDKTVLPSSEFPKGSPLYLLLYGTLVFGAVFTIVGTLLGGVWADFAWGRFWGFDPKECGALFVILWAMLSLHLRAGRIVSARVFVLLNCFNVIVTFLCWFGINLLGVGLHSYGFQSGSVMWLAVFVGVDLFTIFILCRFLPRAT
jgi:ABC-type transport system involved in cytochrome c biogenesis permease subunit